MGKPDKKRIHWMAEFERLVTTSLPAETGHIDWNSPIHFYSSGMPVRDAADKYIAWRHREEGK